MKRPIIGFAGMTHLGVVSAVAAAARGGKVVGYDADRSLIAGLILGKPPVLEPGLDRLLKRHAKALSFSADVASLGACDVVYIAADVPTDDEARSNLAPIRTLIDGVVQALNRKAVLVVLCQVPPGFTRELGFPKERLYYQVETLIFGRAVERATRPERFILGCADPAKKLPPAYAQFLKSFGCLILPMRYESAELAKIAINFMLVASVSAANTLAEISEKIGADWSEISPALRLDARIGKFAYLTPGLGISGGNLERDLRTGIVIGNTQHTDTRVIQAWIENSVHRKDWLWDTLDTAVLSQNPDARIAVLGLAYKENTHSTKNSPSLALLAKLEGKAVTVHDPVVPASAAPWARSADDPLAAAKGADVLVIATPWPQYCAIKPRQLKPLMAGRVILDPYRVLDGRACARAGFAYYTLGMPPLRPSA